MEQKLDIIKCYKEAWQCFKARPGLAIGGTLLYVAIVYSGQLANLLFDFDDTESLLWLVNLLVVPPLSVGISVFSINLAGMGEPRLYDLFAGFKIYWKSIGLVLLFYIICVGLVLPGVIILVPWYMSGSLSLPALSILSILYFVAMFIVLIRWYLVYLVLADEPETGIVDCLKRSWQLTTSNRLRLFGLYLMAIPILLLGVLALGIGIFVALPICMIAMARAYLWLKSFHPPLGAVEQQQSTQ